MTFGESIRTCLLKYATFEGRATRSEYWFFFLFTLLVPMAASIVSEELSGVFSILFLLPSIAVGVRRLHDIDKSGWFFLLWFIPLIGWIFLIVWAMQEGKEPNRFSAAA
jgi:uncharacterized membrane protein YhaH (DUF805 family)